MRTGRRKVRLGDIWSWNQDPSERVVVTELDGSVGFTDGIFQFQCGKEVFLRDFTLVVDDKAAIRRNEAIEGMFGQEQEARAWGEKE